MKFYISLFVDDGINPLSDDSDSDFQESVLGKKQKGKQKPKKEDMPSEPISTASSLLNILTGLLDSEVFKKFFIEKYRLLFRTLYLLSLTCWSAMLSIIRMLVYTGTKSYFRHPKFELLPLKALLSYCCLGT